MIFLIIKSFPRKNHRTFKQLWNFMIMYKFYLCWRFMIQITGQNTMWAKFVHFWCMYFEKVCKISWRCDYFKGFNLLSKYMHPSLGSTAPLRWTQRTRKQCREDDYEEALRDYVRHQTSMDKIWQFAVEGVKLNADLLGIIQINLQHKIIQMQTLLTQCIRKNPTELLGKYL